ncbi:unnamed protein product [Calicophoron daubneyi]|uniref:SH3 domain-binding protein 5-like protein n=1 Tax=Calicophoron daubneyi TaxID=300641 RepID=A0AAV2T0P9_CALDB
MSECSRTFLSNLAPLMDEKCIYDTLPLSKRQEIESQLDVLNRTSTQINELENKLLAARAHYRDALQENSTRLKRLTNRLGKCVERARPYFEIKQKQFEVLQEIQSATERYDKAKAALKSAHETFAHLENSAKISGRSGDLDALETLNQSIMQINSAKQELQEASRAHELLVETYNANELTIRQLERRNKFDINKARPYFATRQRFEQNMQEAKIRVEICAEKVALCKSLYAEAMLNLEHISESVHDTRRRQTITVSAHPILVTEADDLSPRPLVRGEGVGAESVESVETETKLTDRTLCYPSQFPHSFNDNPSTFIISGDSENDQGKQHLCRRNSAPSRLPLVDGLLHHMNQANLELGAFESAVRVSAQNSEPQNSCTCSSGTSTMSNTSSSLSVDLKPSNTMDTVAPSGQIPISSSHECSFFTRPSPLYMETPFSRQSSVTHPNHSEFLYSSFNMTGMPQCAVIYNPKQSSLEQAISLDFGHLSLR